MVDPNKNLSLFGPGYWDDFDKNKNISKFNVKVKRCQNSSATAGTCSTTEEIDEWLQDK